MLDPADAAIILTEAINLSDAIYTANHGAPLDDSIAAREVAEFDDSLAEATGLARPLFGAYADAEFKLRALNDLIRSTALLLPRDGVSVGFTNVARAALETAGRLHWILCPDGSYTDRAERSLRERLRVIDEVRKMNPADRDVMDQIEKDVRDGATRAGLQVRAKPPAGMELITDLLVQPGVLRFDGINRNEMGAIFYRLPSASMHAALHGLAVHHPGPAGDPHRRMTAREPWEHTVVMVGGLFAGYANVHKALFRLYGWDCAQWNAAAAASAQRLAAAREPHE